jgi:hypothetical protein
MAILAGWHQVVCAPNKGNGWQFMIVRITNGHLHQAIMPTSTDVHDVTELIHRHRCRGQCLCIYLEPFSFSLMCTIDYMYMDFPNVHIVTGYEPGGYYTPNPYCYQTFESFIPWRLNNRFNHIICAPSGSEAYWSELSTLVNRDGDGPSQA